jgi:transcriptional regulator with XRE-family HTH domain
MSRESAGAAIRALRESRDWSLADLAAATGVSIMGLSYLERGARKPHKGTVQKVENGLGLPPGTYSRLLVAADPDAELARLIAAQTPQAMTQRRAATVVVDRHSDTEVLEGYAEAQLDAIKSVIDRLPATTSNEYETYILSVIAQCVKAEMLAASSWRVAISPVDGAPHRTRGDARRPVETDAHQPECSIRRGMRAIVVAGIDHRGAARCQQRRRVGHPQPWRHTRRSAPACPRLHRNGRVGEP